MIGLKSFLFLNLIFIVFSFTLPFSPLIPLWPQICKKRKEREAGGRKGGRPTVPLLGLAFPLARQLSPIHPLKLVSPRASGISRVPDLVPCGRGSRSSMPLWDKGE